MTQQIVGVLKTAMPAYIVETDRGAGYMCLVVESFLDAGLVEEEAGLATLGAIMERIEREKTLYGYLAKHDLPREAVDRIAFYKNWIEELENEEAIAG